ncbi:MAG: cob(I)yrinic acid a,c-diamide adenosyltransferase [Desulfopila sp.]|jgi:cob(I)alamin adenosyltransferase|nr:cob(I)yrinic acid a,c-diamide adenosyltransferase [Desulfopila sp.]
MGRIIVNTGNGKGKTTAALGLAFRALGHGQHVCVLQFLKGKGDYGERLFAENITNLEWHICGKGFVFNKQEITADREVARQGFELAREKVLSDQFDLIIFDEITYLPLYGFLDVFAIVELLQSRPERLNVVLTGRNADEALCAIADTVTRMEDVKHAFNDGVKAQKGIEY